MKRIPLNYYVNLTITDESVKFYRIYNPKGGQSDCASWFAYVETYLNSNSKLPEAVKQLMVKLVTSLGDIYGFNIDKAWGSAVNYFVNSDYKKYLDFFALRKEYLDNKN